MSDITAELASLRAELQQAADEPHLKAAAEAVSEAGAELEEKLAELRDLLADAGDETREIVAGHPLAAVAAAFLLGVVVGRMTGRG